MIIDVQNIKIETGSDTEMSVRKSIVDNAKTIVSTPRGSVYGNRSIGIKQDFLGCSFIEAQNRYTMAAIDAIEEQEKRTKVSEIKFPDKISDELSIGNAKVVLEYNVK